WLGGNGRLLTSSLKDEGVKDYAYTLQFKEGNQEYGKVYIQEANRLQVGLDFGAGISFPVQHGRKMLIEARYSEGHSYLGKANSANYNMQDYSDNLELSHKVLNLSVAYVFEHHIHGWKRGKSVSK
ncbi:MAG: hypothetical protein M3421_12835, partial [Bacteroidota bacterium]|nr:hypothetical protein [Bacteroidota bacterium]